MYVPNVLVHSQLSVLTLFPHSSHCSHTGLTATHPLSLFTQLTHCSHTLFSQSSLKVQDTLMGFKYVLTFKEKELACDEKTRSLSVSIEGEAKV